ncbi:MULTISPECIES: AAA family ATPase [unclassified Herbaspirillum]|uniref:AAA family ATPase n=1 Tax=unclassified Herbaspirillum TaxID=2624150 RepID=UPI00114EC56A|nr:MULTISPECIES: AAA family ATPase [unclassified Herbaspirillum]MBB5393084.1 putative ATPase [Herbaspirillum sp. SJZ102]TQK04273.1 putative ATPase [Herbaspirillum sp. SJZ130]TQK09942.1 putative ATPase [Herbaspirillum sp. SJZ106]
MISHLEHLCIITGGPGAGKTSLLHALQEEGHGIKEEVGRAIIRQQMASEGRALPWKDKLAFAQAMLAAEVAHCRAHAVRAKHSIEGIVFCDRGIPDLLGYMRLEGLESLPQAAALLALARHAAKAWRYSRRAFILPPWKEIYETDRERKQSWEEAVATYDVMREIYEELGYRLVEVPAGKLAQRRDFILRSVGAGPQ